MIKIEIEIIEKGTKDYNEIIGKQIEVSVQEIGKNATDGEKEVSKHYKERLEVDKKFQYINKTTKPNKKVLDELINELFSI